MADPKLSKMKAQVYKDPRPASSFTHLHERARTQDPNWVYEAVHLTTALYAFAFLRARCIGSDNIPASGPVILAPNHFSFMDHFLTGAFTRRKVRFMAKSQLFSGLQQHVYAPGGVFPVRRGHQDEEAFTTAETILGRGGLVCMYCEGGRSRTGELADQAKPGIGRLALETGAAIVPTAIHGSHRIRNWKRAQFPHVTVQYGKAFRFDKVLRPERAQSQQAADAVFAEIKALYAGLEQHGRSGIAARVRAERRAARRPAATA